MTALPAQSVPATSPRRRAESAPRRRLRIAPIPGARTRPRIVYAVVALAAVGAIVAAQLMLSVAVTQGAYEIDGYQTRETVLGREKQSLTEDLDKVQSPQYLAKNAEAFGMVPNVAPVYLRLSDGAVLGTPKPAAGAVAPSAPLVPNALVDGAPPVTGQPAGQTPAQSATGVAPTAVNLPTPATH